LTIAGFVKLVWSWFTVNVVFAAVEFCCLAKLVSDVLVAFVVSVTFVIMVPLVLIEM